MRLILFYGLFTLQACASANPHCDAHLSRINPVAAVATGSAGIASVASMPSAAPDEPPR